MRSVVIFLFGFGFGAALGLVGGITLTFRDLHEYLRELDERGTDDDDG